MAPVHAEHHGLVNAGVSASVKEYFDYGGTINAIMGLGLELPRHCRSFDLGGDRNQRISSMNRTTNFLIIGALSVAVAVLGYWYYQERQQKSGIEINVGRSGITVETK